MSPEESSENDESLSKSVLQARITGIEVVQFILLRNKKTLQRNMTVVLKHRKGYGNGRRQSTLQVHGGCNKNGCKMNQGQSR